MKPKKQKMKPLTHADAQQLRDQWQALYALGDAAIAKAKTANAHGDEHAALEAMAEFHRAFEVMRGFRAFHNPLIKGMRSAAGAENRKKQLLEDGAATRTNVLLAQANLRAQGVPERKLNKKIAQELRLSVQTVRDYRK